MDNQSTSHEIDSIIKLHSGWKGETLTQLRATITQTDTTIEEEVKWKMASRPEGLPVWSYKGILCFAEIWKDNIKLLFPNGSKLKDSKQLFNARLKSKTIRAIELHEGDTIAKSDLRQLVREALEFNRSKL